MDDLRPIFLGLADPLVRHWMVLGDIAAFNQDGLAMLKINPMVGHRTPTERCPQTGDRWAVSKTSLVFDESRAKQACGFLEKVTLLIRVLCAAHERDRVGPVDGNLRVA